jgi:uncharacterized circularly permuted ATP-grasp superfamily protein
VVIHASEMRALLPPAADECVEADGSPRSPYQRLFTTLAGGDHLRLGDIQHAATGWFGERGVTFGAPAEGTAPIFPFDPVPRILGAAEWRELERGLAQRAVALDHFVADCYGAQRALRHGVVPAALVYSSTGSAPRRRAAPGATSPASTWCASTGSSPSWRTTCACPRASPTR